MKRCVILCLILLLLSGCAAEPSADPAVSTIPQTAASDTSPATEAAPTLDSLSDLTADTALFYTESGAKGPPPERRAAPPESAASPPGP